MSILSFLVNLFTKIFGGLTAAEKTAVSVSSKIIDAIKTVQDEEEHPLEAVLSVIPEELKEKFTQTGVEMLFKAGLIHDMDMSLDDAIKWAATNLRTIAGSLNHKVSLNNLGIFLTDVLADGKIGWNDLAHLPKLFYDHSEAAE